MRVHEPTEGDGTTQVPGFMTVKEVARMLSTSPAAIYNRLARGNYDVRRAGRTLLLSEATVLKLYSETRHYVRQGR